MSDGLTDSYRMQDEYEIKQKKHQELLKLSPEYKELIEDIHAMRQTIQTTQHAIDIMELQASTLLTNYIKKS